MTPKEKEKLNELLEPVTRSYYQSHTFENSLTDDDEGEFIAIKDVIDIVEKMLINNKTN